MRDCHTACGPLTARPAAVTVSAASTPSAIGGLVPTSRFAGADGLMPVAHAAAITVSSTQSSGSGRSSPASILMRVSESPSGRLGAWWPPAGEHFVILGCEP
jgi:hypothetical protein